MKFEPKASFRASSPSVEFAVTVRKPLVLLRNTERALRLKTVETLVPILPSKRAISLSEASQTAEESLSALAKIELDEITDAELRPARILVGLTLVGFGALLLVLLLLYCSTLHPELNTIAQVRRYWYQYIGSASLGLAGLFMLGREAMRPSGEARSDETNSEF